MTRQCPICEKAPAAPAFRPFCSARCADLDLGRWLAGAYVIPGMEVESGERPRGETDGAND